MATESLKQNIQQIKEIIREIYIFTNQLNIIKKLESDRKVIINTREKVLLNNAINSLLIQLKILNQSLPELVNNIGFFKKLKTDEKYKKFVAKIVEEKGVKKFLVQIKYKPSKISKKISVTIGGKDKMKYLNNLTKSNLSISRLKKRYSVRTPIADFGKSSIYARISNHFFREYSNKLLNKGYLGSLNRDLRKINSRFVVGTYASMIFFTTVISIFVGSLIFAAFLFYNIHLTYPILVPTEESFLLRFVKFFWIIIVIPSVVAALMYFYPKSEARNIGAKINQELPFVTIHMSAIATSGVEPVNIFKIIVKSEEYVHTRLVFRRILNLINLHGYDLVTALKKTAQVSPSIKLKELLESIATSITSGGSLSSFLNEHAETLFFEYRLEREKYTKTSETFMDIYISIVIAAPMILLILFVIMGSTGLYFLGITPDIMGFLIILAIVFLNIGFIVFLKMSQPVF